MKLLEARFGDLSDKQWSAVADYCAALFGELGEVSLNVISATGLGNSQIQREDVLIGDVAHLLKQSLIATCQLNSIRTSDIVTIKSTASCRFIVTEDDGVLRICLASDDPAPDFSSFGAQVRDVSHLLITTDLFDYI